MFPARTSPTANTPCNEGKRAIHGLTARAELQSASLVCGSSLLIQPCCDALHHISVKRSIEAVGDISDVWGRQHVVHASKRMLWRQWFLMEHINCRSCDCTRTQCPDERWLINDRATRGIDQSSGWFHLPKLGRSDKTLGEGA